MGKRECEAIGCELRDARHLSSALIQIYNELSGICLTFAQRKYV